MSHDGMIEVGIFARQTLILEVLRDRLNAVHGIKVIAANIDFTFARELVRVHRPDILILDLSLGGKPLFELLADLRGEFPEIHVVLLGENPSNAVLSQVLLLDLSAYVMKSESFESFVDCLRKVAEGEKVYSEEVRDRIICDAQDPSRKKIRDSQGDLGFSPRQMDVFLHLARGLSVKEVARVMQLSQKSIDSHKYRIMGRLGLHDRVELTLFALREHLIEL